MNWGASYGSGRDSSVVQGITSVVVVTAMTATGKLREWRRQSWELKQGFAGSSRHGWEGENVNGILANPLPSSAYIRTAW